MTPALTIDTQNNPCLENSLSSTDSSGSSGSRRSADDFIGGSTIRTKSKTCTHELKRLETKKSIYEEDSDSSGDDEEECSEVPVNASTPSTQHASSSSRKIFPFSLPFGGKLYKQKPKFLKKITGLITPITPLSGSNGLLAPTMDDSNNRSSSSSSSSGKPDLLPTREEVKLKLKRQESISSLEEIILFDNVKKRDNYALRSIRKLLTPEIEFKILESEANVEKRVAQVLSHELEGDVVIISGFRGSTLRVKSTGERIWIPLKKGLRINNKADLLIGPKDEDQLKTKQEVVADGIITHLGPVDICKKLVTKLKSNPNVKVHKYGYDWRLDLDMSSEDFSSFLAKIVEAQEPTATGGKKGVYIVAHSMGGLVSHKVLQEHTDLVRGIVYCGSPSRVPSILGPLRHGDQVLFNKKILSCETNFFMRSSFYFLPEDKHVFIDQTDINKKYDLDYFDWKTWCEYGLSPLVDANKRDSAPIKRKPSGLLGDIVNAAQLLQNREAAEKQKNDNAEAGDTEDDGTPDGNVAFKSSYEDCVEYLKVILPRAKSFLHSLEYIPGKKYPPLAQVYSRGIPTVRGCKMSGYDEIRKGNYDNFYYGPGDGVIHYKWLLPEQRGFHEVGKFETDEGHTQLLTDVKAISKAFMYILDHE